jgi:Mrp family chromosome partitioning ATPase
MFASAQREEGTTTCTINAGISAVMQGKSAILVDCDLRRAKLSKHFGVKRGKGDQPGQQRQYTSDDPKTHKVFTAGLSDYLAGEVELRDILQKTDLPKLFFIPAGTRVPNTADLLASKKMATLLKAIEKQVDVVYLDTPAILPLVDATVVAPFADSIIYIIEYRGVTIQDAKVALARLMQANSNLVGCIVNKAKWGKVHYYYYDDDHDEKEEVLFKEKRSWKRKIKNVVLFR